MQLPLAYLEATVIEEVPLDLWRDLFDAVGWPASLQSKQQDFTHEDVLQSLERDDPNDELLQALETLHALGTESGREAIVSAMADRRVAPGTLPPGSSEREFALRLFLGQRHDASLADVYARAQTQVQEAGEHRRYNEFIGQEPKPVSGLEAKCKALEAEILRYCHDNDLGEHVQVRAFDDDGTFVFHIIRSHHTRKPLAVMRGASARATIEYRPVHADIVRYEAPIGRLRVAARAASVVEFYREAVGRVLFGDDAFFDGDPVCDLKVLQERGRAALENHDVFGVGRVWMTECLWERGDRNLLHIRSSDCFSTIEELGLPLTEGNVLQAKLKLEVVGKSTRPITVDVRVPSRIHFSRKTHEALVDELLTRVGIRGAKVRAARHDLWSLYPWRQPIAVWRTVFGSETDLLVKQGVLVPTQLGSVASPAHLGAGRVLEAHRVSDGEFYGVSKAPEIPSQSLSATDLDALELNVEHFRDHLRAELEISGGTATLSSGDPILDLGVLEIHDQRFRMLYALRQPPADGSALMRAGSAAQPVLLMPAGGQISSGATEVLLDKPLPSRNRLTRDIIAASGLRDAVPALFSAPDGTRLVVDTKFGKVWFDGIEIRGLSGGTHPFRFVEVLAGKCPTAVPKGDLAVELSRGRKDGDLAARQAKTAANNRIRAAMKAAGRPFEDPFPSQDGCYRSAVRSYVV